MGGEPYDPTLNSGLAGSIADADDGVVLRLEVTARGRVNLESGIPNEEVTKTLRRIADQYAARRFVDPRSRAARRKKGKKR